MTAKQICTQFTCRGQNCRKHVVNRFVDSCEEWFEREEELFGCSGSMKTHILMITEGWSVSMEKY